MPLEGDLLYKAREDILAEMQEGITSLIPDAHIGEDSVLNLILQVFAGVMESVFLANQIVSQDMFITTANEAALESWGTQFGTPRKAGNKAQGNLLFTGDGGVVIPAGSEVASDPGTGEDPSYFVTTAQGTVPNPGTPTAPTVAVSGSAGNITGSIEYAVAFVTAQGETEIGAASVAVVAAAKQINLTAIPLGGAGTTSRKIFRQKDADGIWKLVTTIGNNTATTYTDNTTDGALGGNPVQVSTAERVVIPAEAEDYGEKYNVLGNTIVTLTDVPDGVVAVTNSSAFVGGTGEETVEDYRIRLLRAIRSPNTGSAEDLRRWAEEIEGVESASVYTNDNLGTPTNGHATTRISGPGGTIPPQDVIDAVLSNQESKDLANITLHVGTFDALATSISVSVTLEFGFGLPDVEQGVENALTDYVNSLAVGETLRVTGVIAAVLSVPGILDVQVNDPTSNQATGADEKRTVGSISVT